MFERYYVVSENDYDAEPTIDQNGKNVWPQIETRIYETHLLFTLFFWVPFIGGPFLALISSAMLAFVQGWFWNDIRTLVAFISLFVGLESIALFAFLRSFNPPPDVIYQYKFLGRAYFIYQGRMLLLPTATAVPFPFGQEIASSGKLGDKDAIVTSLMRIGNEAVQLAPTVGSPVPTHAVSEDDDGIVISIPPQSPVPETRTIERVTATNVRLLLKVVLRVNANKQPVRAMLSYYKELAEAVGEYISQPWRMSLKRNHLDQALEEIKSKAMEIIVSAMDRSLQKRTVEDLTTSIDEIADEVLRNTRELLAEIAIKIVALNIEDYDDAEGADFFAQLRRRTNAIFVSNADIVAAQSVRASRVEKAEQGRIAAEAEQQARASIAVQQALATKQELEVQRIVAEISVQGIKANLALFTGPDAVKTTLLQGINGMSPSEKSAMVVAVMNSLRAQIGGSVVSVAGGLERAITPNAVVDAVDNFVRNVLPMLRDQTSSAPVTPPQSPTP